LQIILIKTGIRIAQIQLTAISGHSQTDGGANTGLGLFAKQHLL
jgi:hypothetical protein